MKDEIERLFLATGKTALSIHHPQLRSALDKHVRKHGRYDEWTEVLNSVCPADEPGEFNADTVTIGSPGNSYLAALQAMKPWRKGPFQVGSDFVDTEWRSDWKWQRVSPHINLENRSVLDIGCGNGYHLFRALGDGARLAIGVDPTILFNFQFALLQKLTEDNQSFLLPLKSEHLPAFKFFDVVLSMGVLYHRRSPLDHLQELMSFLKPGGQVVLETLVVEGDGQTILIPEDRYAKMANVWFIPTTSALELMLARIGFTEIATKDVTRTTVEEQRATAWMDFESLPDFLDPQDSSKTVEGYPAPTRAVLTARKPA